MNFLNPLNLAGNKLTVRVPKQHLELEDGHPFVPLPTMEIRAEGAAGVNRIGIQSDSLSIPPFPK